tara:strand:+ start:1727 stop:2053 length:327 start_codon:yes stop_codon:yes gene_type:complete
MVLEETVSTNIPLNLDNYFLSRTIRFQYESNNELSLLRRNIKLQHPSWDDEFIENFIKSRYADYWFYNDKLKESFYRLSKREREKYRVRLVTKGYLCEDVIKYTETFI